MRLSWGQVESPAPNPWVAAYDDDGSQLWAWTEAPNTHGAYASAVTILDGRIHVAVNAITNGLDNHPGPSLVILAADGAPQMTRTWMGNSTTWIASLASAPAAAWLVQVGIWEDGNWIEALDADGQTIWTANEPVDAPPGVGTAAVLDVVVDADGGIYVVGYEEGYGPDPFSVASYVRKLNVNGDVDWTLLPSPYGGSAVTIADDSVYTAQTEQSITGPVGLRLRAYDAESGALRWQRFVSSANGETIGVHDLQASLGSLWVAGHRWAWVPDGDSGPDYRQFPYVGRFRR